MMLLTINNIILEAVLFPGITVWAKRPSLLIALLFFLALLTLLHPYPVVSGMSTNTTEAGRTVLFSAEVNDADSELLWVMFTLDNGSGVYVNDTYIPLYGNSYSFSTERNISSSLDALVRWGLYVMDRDYGLYLYSRQFYAKVPTPTERIYGIVLKSCVATSIRAVDESYSPVLNAKVQVSNGFNRTIVAEGYTNLDGLYSFDSSGFFDTYFIVITKNGYYTSVQKEFFACDEVFNASTEENKTVEPPPDPNSCGSGMQKCSDNVCRQSCCDLNGFCDIWESCSECSDCFNDLGRCCIAENLSCFSEGPGQCCSGLECSNGFCVSPADGQGLDGEDGSNQPEPEVPVDPTAQYRCVPAKMGCENDSQCCEGMCHSGSCTLCQFDDGSLVLSREHAQVARSSKCFVCLGCSTLECRTTIDCCDGYCYKGVCTLQFGSSALQQGSKTNLAEDSYVYSLVTAFLFGLVSAFVSFRAYFNYVVSFLFLVIPFTVQFLLGGFLGMILGVIFLFLSVVKRLSVVQ